MKPRQESMVHHFDLLQPLRGFSLGSALKWTQKQFASFKNTALETKRVAESEIMGFEDFESILVHCQERIRVMVEAKFSDSLIASTKAVITLEYCLALVTRSIPLSFFKVIN